MRAQVRPLQLIIGRSSGHLRDPTWSIVHAGVTYELAVTGQEETFL
jgi:hypothetical protein